MNSIAQMWEEFVTTSYRNKRMPPEMVREYRMIFYTGFNACLLCMGDLSRAEELDSEQKATLVLKYMDEYARFAVNYIAERQRE